MLNGHEFMPVATCVAERFVERHFQFFAEHKATSLQYPDIQLGGLNQAFST